MLEDDNLLSALLSVATDELSNIEAKPRSLKETDIFQQESNEVFKNSESKNSSVIHAGDTDSSDDDENKYFEDRKFNDCGKNIKHLLSDSPSTSSYAKSSNQSSSWKTKISQLEVPEKQIKKQTTGDVYTDPVFGIRIINPLLSSAVLQDRMVGREAIPFSKIARHVQLNRKDKDWVIGGVIVNKSVVKTSQKGSQFCVWTLSDLKDDIKTVSLFLFSGAFNELWKTATGTVVGILNPSILDKKDGSKDEASLSVNNAQKVMIFGQSKDFGTCKSVKKNGEKCNAIVNLHRCEFCLYHIKQEYQKCSIRSDLQSNFTGRGLTALRNKVLGKNEVFYAGKSYMAIPAKKNRKLVKKDENRLQSLSEMGITVKTTPKIKKRKQNANRLDTSQAQRIKDLELLKKLGGTAGLETKTTFNGECSTEVTINSSKDVASNVISKLKNKKQFQTNDDVQKTQYSRNADLIVNLDKKTEFEEKLSQTISLNQSKAAALDVVTKLKTKKQKKVTESEKIDENKELSIGNEFFDEDFDLDYEDPEKSKKTVIRESLISPKKPSVITTNNNSVAKENKLETELSSSRSVMNIPMLSGFETNLVDLSKPIKQKHVNRAKLNALKYIQRNGPLKKMDPNSIKNTTSGKRSIELDNTNEPVAKKSKLEENEFISDRFKKMMAATSKHTALLEARDDEEKEKYFNKLEIKERMEEKMVNTFKVACKAVRCLKCKYTNFSASDICKAERHPLKVFDATKRFFKCGNCSNRTVTLEVVPLKPCKNCGSGKWERTGMMKEKKAVVAHNLSIRGGEQKFINAVAADANINLLVPDD